MLTPGDDWMFSEEEEDSENDSGSIWHRTVLWTVWTGALFDCYMLADGCKYSQSVTSVSVNVNQS